jgi:hypothetical protein
MTNAAYFAVTTDVFPLPKNPGPAATIVARMRAVNISEMAQLHTAEICVYHTYHNVDQVFKKIIIDKF